MNIKLPEAGTYIVAVSGGVDSMALLHVLAGEPDLQLVIAHFDHGIRPNSGEDSALVSRFAQILDLPFESAQGKLGTQASEAQAREARYAFLQTIKNKYDADAIITAHHQDDLLETVILNVLRGTNRRGLSALSNQPKLRRPLLSTTKEQLYEYALANQLEWNEDETNIDERYNRNYVRRQIMSRFSDDDKLQLLEIIEGAGAINEQLDTLLVKYLSKQIESDILNRYSFSILSHKVAREVMASWLRSHSIQDYDELTLERLTIAAKVAPNDSQHDVRRNIHMVVTEDSLALKGSER